MILVELYSKNGCHLCEEAKTMLQNVQRRIPFTLREITLVPGEAFYEEYNEQVPVVHINKVPAFRNGITERMLTMRLRQLRGDTRRSALEGEAE
jgi:glutaredoxin